MYQYPIVLVTMVIMVIMVIMVTMVIMVIITILTHRDVSTSDHDVCVTFSSGVCLLYACPFAVCRRSRINGRIWCSGCPLPNHGCMHL